MVEMSSGSTQSGLARGARSRGVARLPWLLYASGATLAAIVVSCFLGSLSGVAGDPNAQDPSLSRLGLGTTGHPLGLDEFGRDMLARVLEGGRVSLTVGVGAVGLGLVIGGLGGLVAGILGGWVDVVVCRLLDILLAFPGIILALALATALGPSLINIIIAIGVSLVPEFARLARAGAMTVRRRDYVVAAVLAGASTWWILFKHVAPMIIRTLLAYSFVAIPHAILVDAGLSFLGLGVQPPQATWGSMIANGKAMLSLAPHIVLVPSLCLFVSICALNFFGDQVRAHLSKREA